jgi:hypothetical protein
MTEPIQENNEESIFGGGEFVLTRRIGDNGEPEFLSGGYKIKSFLLESEISPLTTFNNGINQNGINQNGINQNGGKVSSPFENLAVPAGLFYINQRVPKNTDIKEDFYYKKHETISDDIMDKLFGLVESNKKQKRKTRKHIIRQDKRKSRKHNK